MLPTASRDISDGIIFLFDAVVTNYKLKHVKANDPKKLIVSATIDEQTIDITASRINVTEYKPLSSHEIVSSYRRLSRIIQDPGIPINVRVQGRLVGTGTFQFPYDASRRITEGMSDVTHSGVVQISLEGDEIGQVELLCRLMVKCVEIDTGEKIDCQGNVNRSINPQDIMFVMGTACPTCKDACQDVLLPNDGDQQLQQELLRYQRINMQQLTNTDLIMHNSAVNAATYEVTQMSPECAEIVESVIGGNAGTHVEGAPPDSSYGGENSRMPVCAPTNVDKSNCSKDPIPMGEWPTPFLKPIRFCPICLTSMSWLPKFAACPVCGVKPTPVGNEAHTNKKLTADQIIIECLGKSDKEDECVNPRSLAGKEEASKVDPDRCRCTCKLGKECAHCRIRNLCADIFQSDSKCKSPEAQNSEDICMIEGVQQKCRPHLARVFSELRELYNIEVPKPNTVSSASKRLSKIYAEKKLDSVTRRPVSKGVATVNKTTTLMGARPRTASEHKRAVENRLGHKECLKRETQVPKRHGWAWQSSDLTVRYGWTPGSIWRPIRKLMKFFLQPPSDESGEDICNKKLKEMEEQLPTLNVCKKNGKIYITLRPLYNSYPGTQPITFQITKSDKAVTMRQIKSKLKSKGFEKCTCHKPLMLCVCRNQKEKRKLVNAVDKECARRGIAGLVDDLVLTDTSDSEMEYNLDVSLPAATEEDSQKGARNFTTQTSIEDRIVKPKYPIDMNPMKRGYNCATGNRFMNLSYFGAPGENIIADGRPFGAWSFLGGRSKVSNIWGMGSGGPGGFYRPGGLPRLQPCNETGGPGAPGGFYGPGGPGTGSLFGLGSSGLQCDPTGGNSSARSKNIPVRLPKRLQKKPKEPIPPENRTVNMMKYLKTRGEVPRKKIDYTIPPPFFGAMSNGGIDSFGAGTEYYGYGEYGQYRDPSYLYQNNPCCCPY